MDLLQSRSRRSQKNNMKKNLYLHTYILFSILLSQNDGTPPNLIPISSSSDYYQGSDIMIESFVEDQSDIRDVLLFYRFEKSDRTFQVVSMSPFSNVYQGTIPANEVNNEKFEYYVMAIDEFGNQATWPDQSLYDPNVYMLSDSDIKDESDLNKKIESKVEVNLISPAKLVPYEEGVSLVMVSIYDPDLEINLDDLKIVIDKKNVTSSSIVSTEMVTFVPQNLLSPGEHSIELIVPSSEIHEILTFRVLDQVVSQDASSIFTSLREDYNLKGNLSWNADFDESVSRPDDVHKLNITSKFNVGDYKFSVSGLFNTHIIDRDALSNLKNNQDIDRTKFIMSSPWLDFKYGDFTPDFSNLTLKGTRVRGLFTKLKLGFINLTFVDGETKNLIKGETSSIFLEESLTQSKIDSLVSLGYTGLGNGVYDPGEDFIDCADFDSNICEGDDNWEDGYGNGVYDFGEKFTDLFSEYSLHQRGTTQRKLTGLRSQLNLFDTFTWGISGFTSYDDSESILIPDYALDQYGLYGNLVVGSDVGLFLNSGRTRLIAETAISAYNNILEPSDIFTDTLGIDISNVENILGFPITNDLIVGVGDGRGLSIPLPSGNGEWDDGEEFVDCGMMSGEYRICSDDLTETYIDTNGNQDWDPGEDFDDTNNNGIWNDSWENENGDMLGNGVWDEGEAFVDDPMKNVDYMNYLIEDIIKRGTYRIEFRTPINYFEFAKFDIVSEMKRVPTNFSSLGNSSIQSDIISNKSTIKSKFFRDQISLSLGFETQEDNVNGKTPQEKTKPVTTTSDINSIGVAFNITGFPKISYAFRSMKRLGEKVESPKWDEGEAFIDSGEMNGIWNEGESFTDDPISSDNSTATHTISPTYRLKLGSQSYNLSGNFMLMKYDDKENATLNFSNNSYSLSVTASYAIPLTLSSSLGLSSNTPDDITQSSTNFTVLSGKASYKFSQNFSAFFGTNFVVGLKDKNGYYDSGEIYIDDDEDGSWSEGEAFQDQPSIDNFKSTYKAGMQYSISESLKLTFSLDYLMFSDKLDSSKDKAEFKSKLQFKYQF